MRYPCDCRVECCQHGVLKPVANAPIEGALISIGENGNFYVMTGDKIYKITVDGKISTLVEKNKLVYNKGLYQGKHKEYAPIEGGEPAELNFFIYTRFTVDEKDNIILIDGTNRTVRRINVNQE